MSDGVPKSRVTLTYDTKQPEGRRKARELPFRLLVLGDVGGDKTKTDKGATAPQPLAERKLRQLNGRNLGEVIKGLKIKVKGVKLDEKRSIDVLIDSMSAFSPDNILKLLTGQKAAGSVDEMMQQAWGKDATAAALWAGDPVSVARWQDREAVDQLTKSYQNSKTLRTALKKFGLPPVDDIDKEARKQAMQKMKLRLEAELGVAGGDKPVGGGDKPAADKPKESDK